MSAAQKVARRLVIAVCCAALVSCAGTRRWTSDVSDYEQYRRVRLAQGVPERLAEGWVYLKTYPRGAFRDEVEPWFLALEEQMRLQSWESRPRLRLYLESLPDAPHAGQVAARLAQLENQQEQKQAQELKFLKEERERKQRLDQAKLDRSHFVRSFRNWLEFLSMSKDFGKPLRDWDPEFTKRLLHEAPMAVCDAAKCSKRLSATFELPQGRGLIRRSPLYEVILHLQQERLAAIELSGFELFNRLSEAATLRSVAPGDLQARAEAIALAVQLISMAVERGFPEETCANEVVSPVVVSRSCEGRAVQAVIAEDSTSLDRVIIAPVESLSETTAD